MGQGETRDKSGPAGWPFEGGPKPPAQGVGVLVGPAAGIVVGVLAGALFPQDFGPAKGLPLLFLGGVGAAVGGLFGSAVAGTFATARSGLRVPPTAGTGCVAVGAASGGAVGALLGMVAGTGARFQGYAPLAVPVAVGAASGLAGGGVVGWLLGRLLRSLRPAVRDGMASGARGALISSLVLVALLVPASCLLWPLFVFVLGSPLIVAPLWLLGLLLGGLNGWRMSVPPPTDPGGRSFGGLESQDVPQKPPESGDSVMRGPGTG